MSVAAARQRAERINITIIGTLAARRARIGDGQGDRTCPGPARPAMELITIVEDHPTIRDENGKPERVEMTRPGVTATRRRLPAILSKMPEDDPRRVAADLYALAAERIGSMAGASAEGVKADGGPASNDGGVTSRIGFADTLSTVERLLDRLSPALVPGSGPGRRSRRVITARELIDAICLDGRDMKSILVSAGWSGQRRDVAKLGRQAAICLEGMAVALGIIEQDAMRLK